MLRNLNNQSGITWLKFLVPAIMIAAIFYGGKSLFSNGNLTTTALAQNDPLLERRVSQLEQRFYTIETRISRLEQESRLPSITPRTNTRNDTEISLLRTQIDTLQLRLRELECGVVRVD